MRGKKYKAKDRTVQKAGRGGLMEINLHSHEQTAISSREKETAARNALDSVNYRKIRGRGHSAGSEKRKRRRRAAVPGDQSGAGSNAESVRQDHFKLQETSGAGQFIETSGMGSPQGSVPEPCSPQTETAPDTDEKPAQAAGMAGVSRAVPEMTAGYESSGHLAGMPVRVVERQRHGSAVQPRLKYDAAYHPFPDQYGNAGGTETEKAARFREDAQENDMDAQDAYGRLSDAGVRSIQSSRSSIQRAFPRPEMDSRRKLLDSGRKVPWKKKQRIIFRSGEKAGTEPAENGALKDDAGRAESAAGDLENAGARKHGRLGMDENIRKGTCQRDGRLDIFSVEGCPEKRESVAGSGPTVPDSIRKTPLEKKQRIYFRSGEKTGTGLSGNGALKKNTAGREAGRAGVAAGDQKGSGSRKGTDVKKDSLPDSADTGNPEHGRLERGEKKKGGRLNFDEKDSGMVRGAGMGIAKRAARPFFHAVDESGSVCTDEGDESETVQKRIRKNQMAGAAVSGLRHAMGRRSSRMAGYRQRMGGYSRSLQGEKTWSAGGMGAGRGQHPDMDSLHGKNRQSAEQGTKKAARRKQQKKRYKRIYQSQAHTGMWKTAKQTAGILQPGPVKNALQAAGRKSYAIFAFWGKKNNMQWILAAVFILFLACASMFASCSALFQGAAGIVGTTYPGSDEDIRNTEARYLELENALDSQVNGMEATHPGYDEYRYQIDEISHDPYRLASYLTVVCPGYTYAQAEGMLQDILERQYRLTVEERMEMRADPGTGESVEWHVLCISLENRGLDAVAHDCLTEDQEKLYQAYNLTHGNRHGLFGEAGESGGPDAGSPDAGMPAVPGGALSDQRFANMLQEAEKYIGYPYVWGGSTPQTSFDCSGFVSWVINNCGNGWNVGRQTAEGLRGCCTYVPPQDAEPGDLVFFQGTYNTPGASHVGIYVGNNRMLHCGNPIQFTDLGQYWQQHFLQYGRLP